MKKTRFKQWIRPVIRHGVPTRYNWVVQYPDGLTLGRGTDIGCFSYINARHGVEIGEDVQIGSHCSIYSISTIDDKIGRVRLEKGCKVGSHSVVMPGVTIGAGATVGAMTFVNRDIPAGSVAVGVPVRIIKRRRDRS